MKPITAKSDSAPLKGKPIIKDILNRVKTRIRNKKLRVGKPKTNAPSAQGNRTLNNKKHKHLKESVSFIDSDVLSDFLNKKVLLETSSKNIFGVLGKFKGNFAIYEDTYVKGIIDPETITKIVCENFKILVDKPEKKRKHDHTCKDNSDGELIHEEIHKRGDEFVVTTEGGERVLGTHPSKEKAEKQLAAIEISKHSVNEDFSLLLRDRLKSRFFTNISEEVVNHENEFTMTTKEIYKRDRTAEAMLARSDFKPELKNGDTKEEAAHRIATDIVMSGRHGKGYKHVKGHSVEGKTHAKWGGHKTRKEANLRREIGRSHEGRGSRRKPSSSTPVEAREARKKKQIVPNRRRGGQLEGEHAFARADKTMKTNPYWKKP